MKTKKDYAMNYKCKAELFTIDQLRQAFITGGKAGYNRLIGCLPGNLKQAAKIKAIRKLNRLYACFLISPGEFRKLLNLIFEV